MPATAVNPLERNRVRFDGSGHCRSTNSNSTDQNFKDKEINGRWTKAASEVFAEVAKVPPTGFIPFICRCVVQAINAQVPTDQAKTNGKALAIAKFGQP